jgi:hypothetical protein
MCMYIVDYISVLHVRGIVTHMYGHVYLCTCEGGKA